MGYDQNCCECGVVFGVPAAFDAERRKDKRSFYCPNGHPQSYTRSEADRLRLERDRYKQQVAERDDAVMAANLAVVRARSETEKARKATARIARRVHQGVCPCCNRTFTNVARHMATKHPEVVPLPRKAS